MKWLRTFRNITFISRVYGTSTEIQFKNPCDELQHYLQVPLFTQNEKSFSPSLIEMKAAQKLFIPSPRHEIKFLVSAIDQDRMPKHDLPEVTFIGRSNVGKSSLLKAIFAQVPHVKVRVSHTPGHTKTVNFYQVGRSMCLVDMPGYGYKQPEHFVQSVEGYIHNRPNLKRTFLMIDGKAGFRQWDAVAVEMLEEYRVPYGLIMTKIDKASHSMQLRNLVALQEIRNKNMSNCCFPQPFLVSSTTGEGIGYLQAFLAHITGSMNFSGV
ncbi:GTP-binding protein 8-like [Limulus polyphemus]|uniref:GTP-binding protein 8 n=1 Tax=Limulus polyphemus TaxID=6850 RepID=A0ABM1S2P2_LIMPO|nr:GTP-binding protein 8-like [Limulus polyphemus]